MPPRIVLVEDEPDLAAPLIATLESAGYEVTWCDRGRKAIDQARSINPHVLILDRRLPDMDGLDICRTLRGEGYRGTIIMLSAQSAEVDQVYGLVNGADDYLGKPFSVAQLLARVGAAIRRSDYVSTADDLAGLSIDVEARRVRVGNQELPLSHREFDVLRQLAAADGDVVTREELFTGVWGRNWHGSDRVIDVTVGRVRRKLRSAGADTRITTVRGVGFRLDADSVKQTV